MSSLDLVSFSPGRRLKEKETIMKRQWTWIRRRAVLLLFLGVSLCYSGASIKMLGGERPAVHKRRTAVGRRHFPAKSVKPAAVNAHMVDLSLAVRECDDFLLTPALLVQEAVSDDVILTYPEE